VSGFETNPAGLAFLGGHIKTRTHDDIRHGTVTLFAALSYLDGKILSRTAEQHPHKEWLTFITDFREVPTVVDVRTVWIASTTSETRALSIF